MRILAAEWVLPVISPPIAGGAIVIEKDGIIAVGKKDALVRDFPAAAVEDLGAAAILPGFVNCHSHLELTAMRGLLDTVENDFLAWLLKLTKVRAEFFNAEDIEFSALLGAVEGARAGITCFGDVGRNADAGIKALKACGLRGVVFEETQFTPSEDEAEESFQKLKEKFLSLREQETALIRAGISPHSPYTVCAGLFKRITDFAGRENIKLSIHTAESKIEDDFIRRGEGLMAKFWRERGAAWTPPGISPVKYLSSLGVLESKPLLVHCVNVDGDDLDLIAASGSAIAHCPKSNAKFGHGVAPLEGFLAKKIAVGLGSDSVASNNTCDLIEEARFASLLARIRPHEPRFIPTGEMIRLMTLGGARALGLNEKIGSLEVGKQADLAVISLKNTAQMPVHEPESAILFASGGRDVILTVVAGEEIYRDGVMKNVDEAGIGQKAEELVQRISA